MLNTLTPRSAFESTGATQFCVGDYSFSDCADLALASVAAYKGKARDTQTILAGWVGTDCGVCELKERGSYSVFWSAPEQWFVSAQRNDLDDPISMLRAEIADTAAFTDQSDGWVAFDLHGPQCALVLERLCNINLSTFKSGRVQRTLVEHISAFVLCRIENESYRFLCARSYAVSFRASVETVLKQISETPD